jgi:hypothetical protein
MSNKHVRFLAVLISVSAAAIALSGLTVSGNNRAGSNAATFSKDVAPILFNKCAGCHRPGEPAPMSLLTYKDARPWARSIKEKVISKTMPPWHADPTYGTFVNDRRLSAKEIDTIAAWVDAGAPEGDPTDLPPAPHFTEGWKIGNPDQVFTMPAKFDVPAQGAVDYQYFSVPTNLKEDRWVQAAEVRPGNPSVVHHVIVFIDTPHQQGEVKRAGGQQELDSLTGVAPGEEPTVLPDGVGILLPAGATLIFQVHYTPNGTAQSDQTSVGVIFSKKPVVKAEMGDAAMNTELAIPPGDPNYEVRSSATIADDSHLTTLMPHMHWRGKDFQYRLVYPDGTSKIILSVPHYDFGWQTEYRFKEPIAAPKGSRIECIAHFDNSPGNKANPDPAKLVQWGPQTWDEMMIGFYDFTLDHQDLQHPEEAKSTKPPSSGKPEQPPAPMAVEAMKSTEPMPPVEVVLEKYVQVLGGKAAIQAQTSRVMKGTFKAAAAGVTGTIEIYSKAPNKEVTEIKSGFLGTSRTGFDGASGWEQGTGQVKDLPGYAKLDADFYLPIKLPELYTGVGVKNKQALGTRQAYVLEATWSGKLKRWFFDCESGLLLRTEVKDTHGKLESSEDYSDYRAVDGVQIPFTVREVDEDGIEAVLTFSEVKHNVSIEDSRFEKPSATQASTAAPK